MYQQRHVDSVRPSYMTRRQWSIRSATLATSLFVGRADSALSAADALTDLDHHPWIDAHSHIWTPNVQKYPLAHDHTVEDLRPPFSERELLELAHRHGVGRVVLIHHHPLYGWDNSYLVDTAKQFPKTFRVVGAVDNLRRDATAQMRTLRNHFVTGIRITSSLHKERWLAGEMDSMWHTAPEIGQNICCLIDPHEIPQIEAMCRRHPSTPVVIDHFARIGVDGMIRETDVSALCRLAQHRHTTVKISAYYALGQKTPPYLDLVPMIRRLLDAFGPERLMWASDAPYQLSGEHSYEASIGLVTNQLPFLSKGDRESILAKTAERVFFAER